MKVKVSKNVFEHYAVNQLTRFKYDDLLLISPYSSLVFRRLQGLMFLTYVLATVPPLS